MSQTRKADEGDVWSWWKVFLLFSSVCYFLYIQLTSYFGTNLMAQTDMIAETNHKRRKLEREWWALE